MSIFIYNNYTINNVTGNLLHYIKYTTIDSILTAHFYIAEEYHQINGTLLQPLQMKIDIELLNYSYVSNASQLALKLVFESEVEYEENDDTYDEEEGYANEEMGLRIGEQEYRGYFTWAEQAEIDGVLQNVNASDIITDSTTRGHLFLSYPRGNHIYHDPKIGVTYLGQSFDYVALIVIISLLAFIGLFGLAMSKEEYRSYLLNRLIPIKQGPHRLDMEDVLDNENRNKILDIIIDEPGVHYNELLRKTNIAASSLAWHLDILETYKVIHKARVGRYIVFYPYLDKNPFANFNPNIAKSQTTLDIFQIISDHNGLLQSQLARRIDLDHKTVKYHLEKLLEANLIFKRKKGRRYYYHVFVRENNS
jgi:predicted transcriptional regulator